MRPLRSSLSFIRKPTTRHLHVSRKLLAINSKYKIPSNSPYEEERALGYDPTRFYDVAPGQLVGEGRYSVISKLGWGRSSTVWLGKDLHWNGGRGTPYVAIKFKNGTRDQDTISDELALLERLATADPSHPGYEVMNQPVDAFDMTVGGRTHLCLVYVPLRESLEIFTTRFTHSRLPLPFVKLYVGILLRALDYLHKSCHVVHTDLKLDNILMTFKDEGVLNDFVENVQQSELPFKQSPTRRIYESQNDFGPMRSHLVAPILADFDCAQTMESF